MEENNQNNQNIQNNQMTLEKAIEINIKKAKRKGFLLGFLLSLGIMVASLGIYLGVKTIQSIRDGSLYAKTFGVANSTLLDKKTIEKIDTLYGLIENKYIEEVDKEVIRDGMLKGILAALDDPYSVYYNEEEYKEMMESSSGIFEGIGAYLSQDPDTMAVTIVRPITNSPAEAAGLLANDIIVEIDGEDVSGMDLNLVVSKVRGPEGTKVKLVIVRDGERMDFEVGRAKINEESVTHEMFDNNIGYIQITEFADATGTQFIEAYDDLNSKGMESLIIDLRANGGGYVDTAVTVADKLLEEGTIVSIKDRYGIGYSYYDEGDDNSIKVPCVVLVDGNTASSSEILTGALKDSKLATIMGTQTFGKGIVQDVLSLGDGTGVKITSSKYYTPKGENIHGIGIEPDVIVEWDSEKYLKDGTDVQIEAAKNYLLNGTVE